MIRHCNSLSDSLCRAARASESHKLLRCYGHRNRAGSDRVWPGRYPTWAGMSPVQGFHFGRLRFIITDQHEADCDYLWLEVHLGNCAGI